MSAAIAAHTGAERLVPLAASRLPDWNMRTPRSFPVKGAKPEPRLTLDRSASEMAETSGTQRLVSPASSEPPVCQLGFGKKALTPPPVALGVLPPSLIWFQTISPL